MNKINRDFFLTVLYIFIFMGVNVIFSPSIGVQKIIAPVLEKAEPEVVLPAQLINDLVKEDIFHQGLFFFEERFRFSLHGFRLNIEMNLFPLAYSRHKPGKIRLDLIQSSRPGGLLEGPSQPGCFVLFPFSRETKAQVQRCWVNDGHVSPFL